ncbi:hypothetical protein ABZ215_25200 [Amycolatopsis sp. NPDC006131]|uniref:hypothetical protein n=1 Tax=Amycolatopsis sp. NPDC006131 TaxID=3156731 RepID=UPI0033B2D339
MYALANRTVDLYRGTTESEFGDPIEDNTPAARVAAGVLANIEEVKSRVWDPTTNSPRVVRQHYGRVQSTVDVRIGDRVHDPKRGEWFRVTNVTSPVAVGRVPDTVLDLERVTTQGTGRA